MAGKERYKAQQFIDAMPGSGAIVSSIAKVVGCTWHTARKYIDGYPTVREAYEAERERILDIAENVIIGNIMASNHKQAEAVKRGPDGKPGEPIIVDTADVRWYLAMKGRERGYVKSEARELTGKDGGPMEITNVELTDAERAAGIDAIFDAARARRDRQDGEAGLAEDSSSVPGTT